jgi:Maltokinase N-terminal cap domain
MALVHRATLAPSKQQLVESWLPTRSWASGHTVAAKLAEYRFDDPAGEVGVETILWRTDNGAILQTPLTYRAAPLANAETHLIGTSEHSVLGRRWVYDGCGDHVWATTLAKTILTGGAQAQMFFERDGDRVDVPPRIHVTGSGNADDAPDVTSIDSVSDEGTVTVVRAGDLQLALARVVGSPLDGALHLIGRMGDSGEPRMLASLALLRARH